MLTQKTYQRLQKIYFCQVTNTNNSAILKLELPVILSQGAFTDFTGEGAEIDYKEINLHTTYKRNISEKERAEQGIKENITARVFISPLELKKEYGSVRLDNKILANKSKIRAFFLGEKYFVDQILELEPNIVNGEPLAIAIEFRLRAKTSTNKD